MLGSLLLRWVLYRLPLSWISRETVTPPQGNTVVASDILFSTLTAPLLLQMVLQTEH